MSDRTVILIADDDNDSVFLLEKAFEKANVLNPRMVVRNGKEAIDYLSGEGVYADREKYPWPALMLLDLKMPALDGFDVLMWWRKRDGAGTLPIVVMSSSNRDEDVAKAMELGVVAYHIKPSDFGYLVEVARELADRWINPRK